MTWTQALTNNVVYPAQPSYRAYTSSSSLTLYWPLETAVNTNTVAAFNDITMSATSLTVTLDDAQDVGVGFAPAFNNPGSNAYTLLDNSGGTILTATAGACWLALLADNTTASGTWRTFQWGAGTSAASASALAGLGLIAITTTLNQQYPVVSYATSPTFASGNRAEMAVWTGGVGTGTINSAGTLASGWFLNVRNQGTGAFTVVPSGGQLINGATSLLFNPEDSAIVMTDGSAFYTLGFGQDAVFAFDHTSIDVSGAGTYTLSGTELNRISYTLTGTLTGAREIAVPNTVQQYWITNSATGAFSLYARTAAEASPGIEIGQNVAMILKSDGTNLTNADTQGIGTPVAITAGGTGATTAAGARTNLDVPSNSDALLYAIVFGNQ